MNVAALLSELRKRDVRLRAEGDRLHCDAPNGALTPELREELRRRKREVLDFLVAAQSLARQARAVVPLQAGGSRCPIFALPGHNGDVFCFRELAKHLGHDQSFFGLEPPGLDGADAPLTRVQDLALYFAGQIRAVRPEGPIVVAGYCAGGTVAVELAGQLRSMGMTVRAVLLFGSPYATWYRRSSQVYWTLRREGARLWQNFVGLLSESPPHWPRYLQARLAQRRARLAADSEPPETDDKVLRWRRGVEEATLAAVRAYAPRAPQVPLAVFIPPGDAVLADGARRWRRLAGQARVHVGPSGSNGFNMLREPHAAGMAEALRRGLDELEERERLGEVLPADRAMDRRFVFSWR